MAPNLTAGAGGPLLTWLEPTAEGHALYLSQLDGEGWSEPRQLTAGEDFFANWADLPRAVGAGGALYAHWLKKLGDDTYAYGAALARSGDGGETWEEVGLLHDDDSPTEHGFVSYAPLPSGGIQAFWLDGRAMLNGGGMQLRTARLDDGGAPASELLDDRVCECCATDAALAGDGPVVVYRDRSDSEIRDISVVRATEGGWSEPVTLHDDGWEIQGCPVNGPAVAAGGDRVAVAWFTAAGDEAEVKAAFSTDGGRSFGDAVVVDDAQPHGRVDVVLGPRGEAHVSWMGNGDGGAAILWSTVKADGARRPIRQVAATTSQRSAGVPRMVRHRDGLLFAWVEDGEPSRLRTAVAPLP